jgi:hypothetical protein
VGVEFYTFGIRNGNVKVNKRQLVLVYGMYPADAQMISLRNK